MDRILPQLTKIFEQLRTHALLIIIIAVGGAYGYLIYTAGQVASRSPSDASIAEAYKGTNRPKIQESILDKLSELKDQNVQFQALLDEARNNPFAE